MIENRSSNHIEITINGADASKEINNFCEFIGLSSASDGRFSTLLLVEIYAGFKAQKLNPAKVIFEIKELEDNDKNSPSSQRRTKIESQFTRSNSPLKGLWHKHYLKDGIPSMALNLKSAMKEYGIPWFKEKINEASTSDVEQFVQPRDLAIIAKDVVSGNWMRRGDAGKLTGEWIVFAKYENKNYYLCLGQHDEGDSNIRNKIDAICLAEFPFLKGILS